MDLGKSSNSQTPSPRFEHFGHPSLSYCAQKFRGRGGNGMREEVGGEYPIFERFFSSSLHNHKSLLSSHFCEVPSC